MCIALEEEVAKEVAALDGNTCIIEVVDERKLYLWISLCVHRKTFRNGVHNGNLGINRFICCDVRNVLQSFRR